MAIVLSGSTGIDAGSLPVSNCGNTEVEGNLNLSGIGTRITGDFSNGTLANRVMFQTSTSNSNTIVSAIPNGTATESYISTRNNSDAANASGTSLGVTAGVSIIDATKTGTGAYLPLVFATSATERVRIDTTGNVGIGVIPKSSGQSLEISSAGAGICSQGAWNGLSSNAYYNGGWKYANTGVSLGYEQNSGNHVWKNSVSGTAGNTIAYVSSMILDSNGTLLLTSGTGGLGYGTGAGGQVTQLTSKSTAVTLNKPCGTIVTSSSALAAGATVGFYMYNTLAAYSTVCVLEPNIGDYNVSSITENGDVYIRLTNITGTTLSENIAIRFALIKGANA